MGPRLTWKAKVTPWDSQKQMLLLRLKPGKGLSWWSGSPSNFWEKQHKVDHFKKNTRLVAGTKNNNIPEEMAESEHRTKVLARSEKLTILRIVSFPRTSEGQGWEEFCWNLLCLSKLGLMLPRVAWQGGVQYRKQD